MRTLLPFIDAGKAREAFMAFVLPGIMSAIADAHVKRPHLHVVALKPGVPYCQTDKLPVLFEHQVGNSAEWEWPYDKYASGKARITWRTGLSSRDVLMTKPHLMERGDPRYWGSAIIDGVIVGVSGVEPHFDEMFARMTAAAICAEATHYATLLSALGDDAPDFLPI